MMMMMTCYLNFFFVFFFFFFFLTALLAFYSVTIVINEKLHVHNYEGKKINKFNTVGMAKRE